MTVQERVWAVPESYLSIPSIVANIHDTTGEPLKPYAFGTHDMGTKKTHPVTMFKHQLRSGPDIILYWGYCEECKIMRSKKIIGYDESTSMAYVREIIEKGQKV